MKRLGHFILVAAFAFAGGFAAQLVMGTATGHADGTWQRANALMVADDKNKKGIETYIVDGQPGQMFYGEDGKIRLQLGTYTAPGERGMPLVGLSDTNDHLRLLLRIFGPNEVPVLIMKDNEGRDRLVMGLDLSNGDQEPFLRVTDKNGQTRDILAK
jgi:hypothetical protein